MPDKERIMEQLRRLPTKSLLKVPAAPEEVWEEDEGGTHFIVSKEQFPQPIQMTVYSLSVSGDISNRRRIIEDFRNALGQELERETLEMPTPIEFVLWNASNLSGAN